MHEGKRGVLFVFSGPSGVGKGTLKAKLFEEFADQITYSVSSQWMHTMLGTPSWPM